MYRSRMIPDELSQKSYPTGGGADCGPIRLSGTPPVFFSDTSKEIQPMTKNSAPNGKPHPDDDGPKNPPFSEHVQRFRRLLAELIARQIIAARRTPPAPAPKKAQ